MTWQGFACKGVKNSTKSHRNLIYYWCICKIPELPFLPHTILSESRDLLNRLLCSKLAIDISIYLFILLNIFQGIAFIIHHGGRHFINWHRNPVSYCLKFVPTTCYKTGHYMCVVIYCWGGKWYKIKATVKMIIF